MGDRLFAATLALVVPWLLLSLPPHAAGAPTTLPPEIAALEAAGNFAEARARLAGSSDKELLEHAALIDECERVSVIARQYIERQLSARAHQALDTTLAKLNATRDVYLVLHLQRLREISPRPEDVQAAVAMLTRADALYNRKAFKRAKEVYDAVAKESADLIGREQVLRARTGAAKAAHAEIDAEPFGLLQETFYTISPGLKTAGGWLAIGAIALVGFVMVGYARRRVLMQDGAAVSLVDLTASAETRPSANNELNEQLEAAIRRIVRAERSLATVEASCVLDDPAPGDDTQLPPDLAFVYPGVDTPELTKFSEIVQAAPAVQLGPIGFNPQQLWTLGKWLVAPSFRHTLTGTLYAHDNSLVLRVTRTDRLSKEEVKTFSAALPSSAGRAAALLDVAAQIVLSNGQPDDTVTANSQSLRRLVAGLQALEGQTSLETGRQELQGAIAIDPDNWLARFHLAVVLRKQGDTTSAMRHLKTIEKALAGKPPHSLARHVEQYPDFPYLVQYHLASAYAQSGADGELHAASKIFNTLIELGQTPAGHTLEASGKLRRLEMLGRSGDAAVQAAQATKKLATPEETTAAQNAVRKTIRDYVDWYDKHASELEKSSPADHALARGLLLHAYGRTQYLRGDREGAVKSFTEAIGLVPDFADVYVDLANAHRAMKSPADWPQRVTSLLNRALAIDKSHPQARFVYARFYFTGALRDPTKAEEYLRDLPPHPSSLFLHAEVMEAQDKYGEAIDLLDRAIAMSKNGPAYRVQLYGDCLQQFARTDITPRRLRRVRNNFEKHLVGVQDTDQRTRLTRILTEVDARLAKLEAAA